VIDGGLPRGWSGEELSILTDPETGVRAVVAIHDTRLGPAFGGIRRTHYASLGDALADACRLAEAMTLKCAITGVRGGGGKAVIPIVEGVNPRDAMVRQKAYALVGDHVATLGGRYYTGPDVGTTAEDLGLVAERTEFVAVPEVTGDLAQPTARGVFAGIRAVAKQLDLGLSGLRVGVQGVGAVGSYLVAMLADAGARLWIGDVDADAVARCADRYGCEVLAPDALVRQALDVFAPCALGAVVDDAVAEAIPARAVAGSANNVLASAEAGHILHRRGVVYAPDFVINSGALIFGATFHLEGTPPDGALVDGLEVILADIFARSQRDDTPPEDVALARARAVLAATPHRRFVPRPASCN